MKVRTNLTALTVIVLGGCAHDAIGERKYAGTHGNTYDAALNPPQAHGTVTYDPTLPIMAHDYGNGGDSASKR